MNRYVDAVDASVGDYRSAGRAATAGDAGGVSQALAKLAQRNMRLNCTVQEQQVWLGDAEDRVQVDLTVNQAMASPLR